MAQNITLLGATYSDVPAVDLPKTGGGTARFTDTSDATLSSNAQMLNGYTAYSGGTKYTGNIYTFTSDSIFFIDGPNGGSFNVPNGYTAGFTKTIPSGTATSPTTIYGSNATVTTGTNKLYLKKTVSVTPRVTTHGYVVSGTAGNTSVELEASVTTLGATTYTPTTSSQTIASDTYLTGTQTISGDANLVAGNIKSGVSIFGVAGSYQGVDVSDTTATADKVLSGYYFYNSSAVRTQGTAVMATATVSGTTLTLTNGFPVSV